LEIACNRITGDSFQTIVELLVPLFIAGLAFRIMLVCVTKRKACFHMIYKPGDIHDKTDIITGVDLDDTMVQDETIYPVFVSEDTKDV
jgi:hypothetical protein